MGNTIAVHPRLEYLDISNNKFDDQDVFCFAEALRVNRKLDRLDLENNCISDIGKHVLLQTLYDDSSLNAVSDSNHVCTIVGIGLPEYHYQVTNEKKSFLNNLEGPDCNRARKIFVLLLERNRDSTNVRHLESEFKEAALMMAPIVIAVIQTYGDQREKKKQWNGDDFVPIEDGKVLSIVYELCRNWQMPSLYGTRERARVSRLRP